MNNEIELKIIELIDDGATLENSSELKNIIKSSQEAEILYKNILASDKLLKKFFGEDDRKELDNMTEIFVSKKVKKPYKINSLGSKSTIGFAIAASLAVIAFTFFNSSEGIAEFDDLPLFAVEETKPLMDMVIKESEPLYISGKDMIDGLWGPSSELASKIGRNRYEVMYAVFLANKENFIDNNINQPRPDENFFVDLSLVENLDTNFVIDEVKRHIFCSC